MEYLSTNNTSFVRMKEFMELLKVPCNSFHLKYNNPEVQKLDPFSTSLTDDEIELIKEEICGNIYYFFRDICKYKITHYTLPIIWGLCNCKSIAICTKGEDIDNDILVLISYYTAYIKLVNMIQNITQEDTVYTELLAVNIIANNVLKELPSYLGCGYVKTYKARHDILIDSDCNEIEPFTSDFQQRILFMNDNLTKGILSSNPSYIGFNYYMIEDGKTIDDITVIF